MLDQYAGCGHQDLSVLQTVVQLLSADFSTRCTEGHREVEIEYTSRHRFAPLTQALAVLRNGGGRTPRSGVSNLRCGVKERSTIAVNNLTSFDVLFIITCNGKGVIFP